jgi:hypothetical protein
MPGAFAKMKKDEIRAGLVQGWRLCQEEWATDEEIKAVDELVKEGLADVTPWEYSDNFQCERRFVTRKVNPDGEKNSDAV